MEFIQHCFWLFFLPLVILFLLTTLWMKRIAKSFITRKREFRPFSIYSLEFPGSDLALTRFVQKLDAPVKKKVRQHLWIDFLLMIAVYPGISLLCYKISINIRAESLTGSYILTGVALAQGFAWLFDILENLFLLRKIKNPVSGSEKLYSIYKLMVGFKFFIVLTGINSFLLVMVYVWITGNVSRKTTLIIAIIAAVFIGYVLIISWLANKRRIKKERETLVASSDIPAD